MLPPHKRSHCFIAWFSRLRMGYKGFDAHLCLLSLPSGKTDALQDYMESETRAKRDLPPLRLLQCSWWPAHHFRGQNGSTLFIILNMCIINIYFITDVLFTSIFKHTFPLPVFLKSILPFAIYSVVIFKTFILPHFSVWQTEVAKLSRCPPTFKVALLLYLGFPFHGCSWIKLNKVNRVPCRIAFVLPCLWW